MALNLSRNSKVFFTTNVNATTGVIQNNSTASSNTFELQVLDGFTFSQNVNNETVTITEAGSTTVRGQRSFNTSMAPVDFSFSTYVRPKNATTKITAEESLLWNAMFSHTPMAAKVNVTGVTSVTVDSTGLVTVAGTTLVGTLPLVGEIITITGIATTTPANYQDVIMTPGRVTEVNGTTSFKVQLGNIPAVAITASTLSTTSQVSYTKGAWAEVSTTMSQVGVGGSDKHQLQKFGLLFLVDSVLYAVDNCALNQVTVDFGLDQITTLQWSGQATALRQWSTAVTATSGSFSGGTSSDVGASATYTQKVTDAGYISNKLSTTSISAVKAIGTNISAAEVYTVPITGGSITVNNNVTYLTPALLGTVNNPVTYVTGTRAISGSLNAYLKTGTSGDAGDLLNSMLLETTTAIEPMFALTVQVGGSTASTNRMYLEMPAVFMAVPSVDVQQVVSTTLNFTAEGLSPSVTAANNLFDLTRASELLVKYYAA